MPTVNDIKNNKFLNKLKAQAEENPLLTIAVLTAAATAVAKVVDSASAAQGRRAYAKQVDNSVRKSQMQLIR